MKKSFLCFILAFCLLFTALPFAVSAEDEPALTRQDHELSESGVLMRGNSGSCSWIFDTNTGEMTIYGTGEMADYELNYEDDIYLTQWNSMRNAIRSVVIEGTVTKIGQGAFYKCSNLSSVVIKSGVKVIENDAFGATAITSVTIPNSVEYIGGAFYNNPKLKSVDLGYGVKELGMSAFCETGLESIYLPDSLTSIGNSAFSGCTSLSSVTGGRNIGYFGEYVFENTKVKTFTIYQSHAVFEENAFGYTYEGWDDYGNLITPKVYGITLKGYRGSTAQQYCLENPHVTFSPIDSAGNTTGEIHVESFLSAGDTVKVQVFRYGGNTPLYTNNKTGKNIVINYPNLSYDIYSVRVTKKNHTAYESEWLMNRDNPILSLTICPVGDANVSGSVTSADANAVYKHVLGAKEIYDPYGIKCADVVGNGNGITSADANAIYKHVLGTKKMYN